MDPSDAHPVPMAARSHFVACGRCHRIVAVLVADSHPPCFRHVEEQAECLEIRERRASGEVIPDLVICGALLQSLEAKFENTEVEAVVSQGIWYVVRRTPGRPSPLYSPGQARTQADLWQGRGQENLAKQFRRAADQAELRQLRDELRASKTRLSIVMTLIFLAVVAGAAWYFLLSKPTQVAEQNAPASSGEGVRLPAGPARPPDAVSPRLPPPPPPEMTAPVRAPAAPGAPPPEAALSPRPPAAPPPEPPPPPAAPQPEAAPVPPPAPSPSQTTQAAPQPASPPAPVSSPPTTGAPATSGQVAAVTPVQPPALRQPEMVSLRGGAFEMGGNDDPTEKPVHEVMIEAFAISKYPVTVREWNECVAARACAQIAMGKDDEPATDLSWKDAQQYVTWLAQTTHRRFRLPSEAEWEYAARAGTQTRYWWGDELQRGMVNCKGCSEVYDSARPAKAGSFRPNPFGLYDMGGGVDQWVADCWHKNYRGAPVDGSAWAEDTCPTHVIRSGSWKNEPSEVRPASRDHYDTGVRYPTLGFRVALSP
jgi:formylglycine-generating enzyme required for sulfatase activity